MVIGKVILSSVCKWRRLRKVTLQLISSVRDDSEGVGNESYLERGEDVEEGEITFEVSFDWDFNQLGYPGAFFITNNHCYTKFILKSLTLEQVPNLGNIHFVCNSWIHPVRTTGPDHRYIFFSNKAYLPKDTPRGLENYRKDELKKKRGNGIGEPKKWENIYDYDVYNDISDADSDSINNRPILGGSEYPYPRRGRTGRQHSEEDTRYETTLFLTKSIYVPCDERFGDIKKSDFNVHKIRSVRRAIKGIFTDLFGISTKQFESFKDVSALFEPRSFRAAKFPLPQVIKDNTTKWSTDEEFTRQMLAGVNPTVIRRLQEFPPSSKLDPNVYGDQTSKITKEHLRNSLEGLTVDEAIRHKKLYILDYHDFVIQYLRKINRDTSTKTYATRTFLFLSHDGTLKPLAIELSLPHPQEDQYGAISKIMLPAKTETGELLWKLAKAYVIVNDSGHHQLVSHWLNTHAVIEPFVIATNRQLSVVHPIHKLLFPHLKYTMKINALARESLINADGIVEKTQFSGMYSMEMSSLAYKTWDFTQQALPADLINRGVAVEDPRAEHGLRLLIEDYPYAVDGLDIWTTIKAWVVDYCSFYYTSDEITRNDQELQSWWKELREKGHEDIKDEQWWPKMQSVDDLINSCTSIIWISSALHAALNFGQYPYGGFLPNRPSTSKRFLPEESTAEYKEQMAAGFETVFLKIFTSEERLNDLLNISTIELLSKHSRDESYLGQRSDPEWTLDTDVLDAFQRFERRLDVVEDSIKKRNKDSTLKNRVGTVNIPYTLLIPRSEPGITCRGIPNSISI